MSDELLKEAKENRAKLEKEYLVIDGVIKTAGKFEGEPLFVPFYWQLVGEGCFDHSDEDGYFFSFEPIDYEVWPELEGHVGLWLYEGEDGFVWGSLADGWPEDEADGPEEV